MHFVTKATPISYINRKCHTKKLMKSNRTCLIGYSDFISHEWFLIAWVAYIQTNTDTDFLDNSNFNKPGVCAPGLKNKELLHSEIIPT